VRSIFGLQHNADADYCRIVAVPNTQLQYICSLHREVIKNQEEALSRSLASGSGVKIMMSRGNSTCSLYHRGDPRTERGL
jgi:hypothetical protein